jgi:hypothetical protein
MLCPSIEGPRCGIEGCEKPVLVRGLCTAHYKRLLRHGDPLGGGAARNKPPAQCIVEGCDEPPKARGLCSVHYHRWQKYADPLLFRRLQMEFIERALRNTDDACVLWPFAVDRGGYGHVHTAGKKRLAHRFVCERVHGAAPFEGAEAAHFCGLAACINPRHLRWATPKQNAADKRLHGTWIHGERSRSAKLTKRAVEVIRASRLSNAELGRVFGVYRHTIRRVRLGQSWGHVPL